MTTDFPLVLFEFGRLMSDFSRGVSCVRRSGPCQSAGGRFHKRKAASEPHPAENRGDGRGRSPALRHIATIARIARLRQQDIEQISSEYVLLPVKIAIFHCFHP